MIHYHGTPITPVSVFEKVMRGRHFCVSFARPDQLKLAQKIGQSVMYDNGAYSNWKTGKLTDWKRYYAFLELNMNVHIDWSVIPDVIDGSEEQNDLLLQQWPLPRALGAPVWHLHESFSRLHNLAYAGYRRICFGSSGQYSVIGDGKWLKRVELAFDLLCPNGGQPPVAIHMLRGLSQAGSIFPFASADSTNFARNHKRYGSTHDKTDFVSGIDGANCKKRLGAYVRTGQRFPQRGLLVRRSILTW